MYSIFKPIHIATLLLSLILLNCQGSSSFSNGPQLARVGNESLTLQEAREQTPDYMLLQDSVSALRQYRDDWIQRQVILQEARRLDMGRSKVVQKRIRRLEEEIMIQALKDYILAEFDAGMVITDEDARNYFQANKDQLVLDERYVRFRHVVTPDMRSAQAAKRDLMRGIGWPEVARTYSKNPEARIRASQKFWPESMALQEIKILNRMLQLIGITEISRIYRINGDYHFVQLMESRARGDHPDLDWLMEQIKEWLTLEKRRRHFNSYVKNLYLNAQSNNEVDTFNVLISAFNPESIEQDTLASRQTHE